VYTAAAASSNDSIHVLLGVHAISRGKRKAKIFVELDGVRQCQSRTDLETVALGHSATSACCLYSVLIVRSAMSLVYANAQRENTTDSSTAQQ
jgi:hypothetical protein